MKIKVGASIAAGIIGFFAFAAIYSSLHPDDAPPFVFSSPNRNDPISFANEERQTFDLVNEERIASGLRPMMWDDDLAQVAISHSEWMADTGKFDHSGNQYYNCMGENILMQPRSFIAPDVAVDTWMQSSGHKAAIMFESHFAGGVGIVQSDNGTTYYTLIMDSSRC